LKDKKLLKDFLVFSGCDPFDLSKGSVLVEKGEIVHTLPGDGACEVEAVMRDLFESGYEGRFSIEPHIATQVHLGGAAAEGMDQRGIYLEYGERANAIWDRIRQRGNVTPQ